MASGENYELIQSTSCGQTDKVAAFDAKVVGTNVSTVGQHPILATHFWSREQKKKDKKKISYGSKENVSIDSGHKDHFSSHISWNGPV